VNSETGIVADDRRLAEAILSFRTHHSVADPAGWARNKHFSPERGHRKKLTSALSA